MQFVSARAGVWRIEFVSVGIRVSALDPGHLTKSRGAASRSYHQEFLEYEPSKRRGFDHSSSQTSSRMSHSQHEFHSLQEEMDHFRALCVYERYKRTCDEYEEEQRSLRKASKPRSSSSK